MHPLLTAFDALKVGVSAAVAVLLLFPVHLKRFDGSKSGFAPSISVENFMCVTANPNLNITGAQVEAVWSLPENVRMSESMQKTGRCLVAAEKLNVYDSSKKCMCIDGYWLPLVAMCAACYAVVYLGLLIKRLRNSTQSFPFVSLAGVLMWLMMSFVTNLRSGDMGFEFQPYGHMYPTRYYFAPIEWNIAGPLCSVNFLASLIDLILHERMSTE